MKVPAVLKNKYLFYALAVLAALNVIGYASVKAYECLALFLLAGYGMHCYCNNKSLSILAALFVANFVFGCGRVKEGMEDMMKSGVEHMEDAMSSKAKAMEAFTAQADASQDACCKKNSSGEFQAEWKDGLTDPQKGFCSANNRTTASCTADPQPDWTQGNPASP